MAGFWNAFANVALVFCVAANSVACVRTSYFFFDRFLDSFTDPSRSPSLKHSESVNSQALTDQAKRTGSSANQAGTWYLGKRSGSSHVQEPSHQTNSLETNTRELSEGLFRFDSVPTHQQGLQNNALDGKAVSVFPARVMDIGSSVRSKRASDKPKVIKEKPTWYLGKRSSQLESSPHLHRHLTAHRAAEKPMDEKAPWYLG